MNINLANQIDNELTILVGPMYPRLRVPPDISDFVHRELRVHNRDDSTCWQDSLFFLDIDQLDMV